MKNIQIKQSHDSYKIGLDEVVGLETAMRSALAPVIEYLNSKIYWMEKNSLVSKAEYKSRVGFSAYSHNCGGLQIQAIIPKCEEYEFSFLEFGDCDEAECACKDGESECPYEGDGHLDAGLRVFFKFEGIEENTLKFYLYCGGGNGDAPYFRTKYESDVFEASFECKSIAGLKRAASKHVAKLLELISA